jgi:RNA polymerase sigma factor (sigma-70 family)
MSHYRSVYSNQGLNAPTPPDEAADPIEPTDDTFHLENAELVHFGLSRLEVPQRELLTLYFLDDLSIAEIATVLEIPPGTVKSRLSAARRELRRILDEEASRHE